MIRIAHYFILLKTKLRGKMKIVPKLYCKPRISNLGDKKKTANSQNLNTKSANSEGRLYFCFYFYLYSVSFSQHQIAFNQRPKGMLNNACLHINLWSLLTSHHNLKSRLRVSSNINCVKESETFISVFFLNLCKKNSVLLNKITKKTK